MQGAVREEGAGAVFGSNFEEFSKDTPASDPSSDERAAAAPAGGETGATALPEESLKRSDIVVNARSAADTRSENSSHSNLSSVNVTHPMVDDLRASQGERNAGETLHPLQTLDSVQGAETSPVPNSGPSDEEIEIIRQRRNERMREGLGPRPEAMMQAQPPPTLCESVMARLHFWCWECGECLTDCCWECKCLGDCCWKSEMGGGAPGPCLLIACCPCFVASSCYMTCIDLCNSIRSEDHRNQI